MSIVGVALFVVVSVPASIIDVRTRTIPNLLVAAGVVATLASAFVPPPRIIASLTGCAAGFLLFLAIRHLSRGGMGMGDVKFASFVGAATGIAMLPVALFVSAALALLAAVALLMTGRATMRSKLPFAPFLSAGGFTALLAQVLHWRLLALGGIG